MFEAWERRSNGVDPTVAGVGIYKAENPAASHEVEGGAAEKGKQGFAIPEFAD